MKVFENTKHSKKEKFKILGIPIFEQTSDYMTAEIHQKILNGVISTVKNNNKDSDGSNKEIKILGKTILKRVEKDNFRKYYLGNLKIHQVSLLKIFKKRYFKYIDGDYDDVYILRANSGEIYLLLTYLLDSLLKKNGSKHPLFVATKKYHVDMIRMICPEIPCVYVGKLRLKLSEKPFIIDGKRFFLLFNRYYFRQVEQNIKNNKLGEYHYFQGIMDRLGMTEEDISMRRINVSPEDEKSMLEKAKSTGLNLEKFVFISPEAQSCEMLDEDFWFELISQIKAKGYDVFMNLTGEDFKLRNTSIYKTCRLTFAEAFALARLSKKIVSLRSGLTEFLIQTGVPMDVLYTKFVKRHLFNDMDAEHIMSGFTLTKLPNVNMQNLFEYDINKISERDLLLDFEKLESKERM